MKKKMKKKKKFWCEWLGNHDPFRLHKGWEKKEGKIVIKLYLPSALSLEPELSDAMPSGLWTSRPGLDGVGGVTDVSEFSICICNVICIVLVVVATL